MANASIFNVNDQDYLVKDEGARSLISNLEVENIKRDRMSSFGSVLDDSKFELGAWYDTDIGHTPKKTSYSKRARYTWDKLLPSTNYEIKTPANIEVSLIQLNSSSVVVAETGWVRDDYAFTSESTAEQFILSIKTRPEEDISSVSTVKGISVEIQSNIAQAIDRTMYFNPKMAKTIQMQKNTVYGSSYDARNMDVDLSAYAGKKVYIQIVCDPKIFPNGVDIYTTNGKNPSGREERYMPNRIYSVYLNSTFASATQQYKYGLYAASSDVYMSGDVLLNIYYDVDGKYIYNDQAMDIIFKQLYGDKLVASKSAFIGTPYDGRILNTDLSQYGGKTVKFIIRADDDISNDGFAFLTSNGQPIDGNYEGKFYPNILYSVVMTQNFADTTASQYSGLYAYASEIVKSGFVELDYYYNPPQTSDAGRMPLEGKKLWTLWDSLGLNTWQYDFVSDTGCEFSATLNAKNDKPISWGGSNSFPQNDDGTQARAINLVSYKNDHDIDIVIIENINDNDYIASKGQATDAPFMRSQKTVIDTGATSYDDAVDYAVENLSSILSGTSSAMRKKGSILSFNYTSGSEVRGSKITFTHVPTSDGNISISWGGRSFSIHVTTDMSLADIAAEFAQYSFGAGVTDIAVNNTITITYYTSTSNRATFDGASTGVTATVEDSPGAGTYNLYFMSDDVSDWTDTTKWSSTISLYSVYKGLLSYLQKELPKAKLYWATPWVAGVDFSSNTYKDASGDWDADLFIFQFAELYEVQKNVCEMYNVEVLPLDKKSGMSIINIETYFNSNNVHPKAVGYKLYADMMANMIGILP